MSGQCTSKIAGALPTGKLATVAITTPNVAITKPTARVDYWGIWGEWSRCSRTCSTGVEARERRCNKALYVKLQKQ